MKIPYEIKRVSRAKQIKILVRSNGVTVTAPKGVPNFFISKFVQAKRAWIHAAQKKMMDTSEDWIVPEHVGQDSYAACKERARKFARDRLDHYNQFYRFSYNRIGIKNMISRWGSCSSKKNLNFHYRLLFLPVELADYVIVHELCHLQEMNHSKAFWDLVARTIPDHGIRRKELKKYLIAST